MSEKFLGRIGSGKSIHIMFKSIDANGREFHYSSCGADHMTNNGTGRKQIYGYDASKVTCKKCLKREK